MNEEASILALIQRANELLTVLAKRAVSPLLESELSDAKKRNLYELTDGSLPVTAIAKKVGMSAGAISGHWKRWEQLGLLVKDGKQYRRVFE